MDTIDCSCSKCSTWIGKFENLWDQIGKTYYSPVNPGSDGLGGLLPSGEARQATTAGDIKSSFLQDLVCKECGERLGLRCDRAPEGHLLTRDQLILRLGIMSITTKDGAKASLRSIRVRNKYTIGETKPPPATELETPKRSASVAGAHNDVGNENSLPQITASLASEADALPQLMKFAQWAEQAMLGQQNDISRISSVVSKIERDMRSFKDFMLETRKDLAKVPKGAPWERVKRSVDSLEDEMGSVRAELEARPNAGHLNDEDGVHMSYDELDVLTSSITKIGQRVNEVDSLKMEIQFMKSRLKRFEDMSRSLRQSVEPRFNSPAPYSPLSKMAQPPRINLGENKNHGRSMTPGNDTTNRKRNRDELESDATPTRMMPPISSSGKRKLASPATYTPRHHLVGAHKPSCLSSVQLLDDIPDPIANSNKNASTTRASATPSRTSENEPKPTRAVSRPAQPMTTNNRLLMNLRLQLSQRAQSEGFGDIIRKGRMGTPDRRAGSLAPFGPVNGAGEKVLPSIERGATVEVDGEAVKKAQLEARDRLVRETLERELCD